MRLPRTFQLRKLEEYENRVEFEMVFLAARAVAVDGNRVLEIIGKIRIIIRNNCRPDGSTTEAEFHAFLNLSHACMMTDDAPTSEKCPIKFNLKYNHAKCQARVDHHHTHVPIVRHDQHFGSQDVHLVFLR